jgi:plastocyanin
MSTGLDRRQTLARLIFAVALVGSGGRAEAAETSAACPARGSDPIVHEVEISGFAFVPAALAVRPGDKIRWTNVDLSPHTATAKDGSWDTGELAEGESATLDVTETMLLDYHCLFHTEMFARLVVCPD